MKFNKVFNITVLSLILSVLSSFGAVNYYLTQTQPANSVGIATFNSNPIQTNYVIITTTNIVTLTNYVTNTYTVYITNSSPIVIEAESGVITAPFVKSATYISQPSETTLANGGKATYTFSVPVSGNYIIKSLVKAENNAQNSFFINIDGNPTDPLGIWDILPFTSGFQERTVNWRGNGTPDLSQFIPKVFNLSAGQHTLTLIGRESSSQVDKFTIELQ